MVKDCVINNSQVWRARSIRFVSLKSNVARNDKRRTVFIVRGLFDKIVRASVRERPKCAENLAN
jgi:hypothetical protein